MALNFSAENRAVSLSAPESATVLLSTHLDRQGQVSLDPLDQRPYEGVIIAI